MLTFSFLFFFSPKDDGDIDFAMWAGVEIHVMPPWETSSLMIFNLEMNFLGLYQAWGSSTVTDTTEVVVQKWENTSHGW